MILLNASELKRTAASLEEYYAKSAVAQLGGLLTAPELQANTSRLETLVHLAVAHCHGCSSLGLTEIDEWLNSHLGNTQIASLEDPAEDVFITNICTPEGNRRMFGSIWEANDYSVQIVIDILGNPKAPRECRTLLVPVFALLALSDCIAERVGLQRWHSEPSSPNGTVQLPSVTRIANQARAVSFTASDLNMLGINRGMLEPFILRDEDRESLASETIGHSSLERRPLVDFGGDLVLALPHAVGPAIRRFVLAELQRLGYLSAFSGALATHQAHQVKREGLRELEGEADLLTHPVLDENTPPLHDWLFKYDVDKYLHVVLLHDHMDWLNTQGLSSYMEYSDAQRAGLEKYLSQVSSHCRSLPDFAEGMTLIVMGGLGRGFVLGFEDWPDQWRLSIIRISDLLMLADEADRPVARYLKCIKQRESVEEKGVRFQNIDGDYNFYCFWRRQNYRLVPHELPMAPESICAIASNFALPVRKEVRNLADRHVLRTTAGSYVPVMRLGRDAYFGSLRVSPTYVSLTHLSAGVLAGAVETLRGPNWLVIKPREGDENIHHLLYKVWEGFIDLYSRLVCEIEPLYPKAPVGAIEIRLNFDDIAIPESYEELLLGEVVGKPEVTVNLKQRIAECNFPSDLLMNFRQAENTGEKVVLRSIAEGMISLYQGMTEDIEESVLDTLVHSVVGDSGRRVFHLFHSHYSIDRLLARQDRELILLAREDLAFAKLGLSEGCTSASPGTSIVSKTECNEFLHRVVKKVWGRLQERLQQFDRASVIRKMLEVQETAIQDRDLWGRTAQAILTLYTPTDNVHTIAQEQEAERSMVSVAARTILEMAICECPSSGGQLLSRWAMDELLAAAALLIEAATDSDAIAGDLTEPRLELQANGEYTVDRSFYDTVIKPFVTAYYHEEFESAAGKYSEWYRDRSPGERKRVGELFPSQFISAFRTEFGLAPDDAVGGLAELMDLAVECDSLVVETTLGNIRARLTTRRGLTTDACKAFIRTFSIFHRPTWEKPPSGFKRRDLYPWRFRRRLSASSRPILVLGEQDNDKVFFGAGALRIGCEYMLERTGHGGLPQDFFKSHEMKQYIGSVNSERGLAFARSVADHMRTNGWQARGEVQMTELGASADLGDVDVLAWKPSGNILLIECKRLQFARTVAEVANICRRFQGKAKDELDKHVQRVRWVKANSTYLQRIVGFVPDPACIDDRLVTNTYVPFKYLESLPIEADKIGPLESIGVVREGLGKAAV